jgi:hypothetical protein
MKHRALMGSMWLMRACCRLSRALAGIRPAYRKRNEYLSAGLPCIVRNGGGDSGRTPGGGGRPAVISNVKVPRKSGKDPQSHALRCTMIIKQMF